MSHAEDPIQDLKRLQLRMRTLLEESLQNPAIADEGVSVDAWEPLSDAFETETEFVLVVEIAGLRRDDVDVRVDGASLTVSGMRTFAPGLGPSEVQWIERPQGSFSRTFELPAVVDARRISATHEDGLLTLRLPKRAIENGQPFKVTVE